MSADRVGRARGGFNIDFGKALKDAAATGQKKAKEKGDPAKSGNPLGYPSPFPVGHMRELPGKKGPFGEQPPRRFVTVQGSKGPTEVALSPHGGGARGADGTRYTYEQYGPSRKDGTVFETGLGRSEKGGHWDNRTGVFTNKDTGQKLDTKEFLRAKGYDPSVYNVKVYNNGFMEVSPKRTFGGVSLANPNTKAPWTEQEKRYINSVARQKGEVEPFDFPHAASSFDGYRVVKGQAYLNTPHGEISIDEVTTRKLVAGEPIKVAYSHDGQIFEIDTTAVGGAAGGSLK